MKHLISIIALFTIHYSLSTVFAQVTTVPSMPVTDDNITVYFDATKGNAALANFSGTVYMHTGTITSTSTSNSDWKYTQGVWGTADANVAMTSLGNHIYSKTYNIRTFYGIPQGTSVLKLAFVFRNADGSIAGKASDGSDIYVVMNATTMSNYVSSTFINNVLTISTASAKMTIEPYDYNMAKVAVYPDGNIVPDSSYSVVMSHSSTPATLTENNNFLELNCGKMTVHINKNPVRLAFMNNNNNVLKQTVLSEDVGYFSTSTTEGLRFKLSKNEAIYGTGSRATPINKRGQSLYSYNQAHYDYTNGQSTLNINIPFIASSAGYGLYIENRTAGVFDIGSTSDSIFQYTAESGKLSYYVMTGYSYDTIMNAYTNLTGKQPLPPRWGLGYIQSRFGYHTETEARTTVSNILNADYPLDAIVLDVYWFGQLGDMGNFSWNTIAFPNYSGMISDFKKLGVNTILISEPYVTQNSFNYAYCDSKLLFGTDQATGKYTYIVKDFFAGSAGLLDIFKPATREWVWSKYKTITDGGVAGWWCDVEEPENHPDGMLHYSGTARQVHNVFALSWAGMLYNKYKSVYPDQRLFDLMRSGFAGMQRFSTFPWSGDVDRSFAGLQAQMPIMLGMSMSGVGYMSSDLGGFATGTAENPELYTRWLQFGAFTPVFRPHSQEAVAPEPNYYPSVNQIIIRSYIKLRYQLMPYNYTMAWKNTTSGRPLTMPINYFELTNASLANVSDEYLWGENFLIAPVITAGQTSRNVLFPSGKWINYWTNQIYNGNSTSSISAPLEQMPVFVRAGSFIPMVPPYKHTKDYNTDTLIVNYYPDNSNPATSFSIYDDDGKTPDAYSKGSYELLNLAGNVMTHETDITLTKTGNGFTGNPSARKMIFQVKLQYTKPFAVYIDGRQIKDYSTQTAFNNADTATFYDATNKIVYVKYLWHGGSDLIVITNDNTYTNISNVSGSSYYLQTPYPNPFSNYTTISYNIIRSGNYSLNIYSAEGKLLLNKDGSLAPGNYTFNWHGTDSNNNILPAGLYIVCLSAPDGKQWSKLIKQ